MSAPCTFARFRCHAIPAALAVGLFAAALGGCTVNPATGEETFTAFMSPAEEQQLGGQEHPKIVAQFGGEYHDTRISAYVDGIGRRLASVSEQPDLPFTFTVLNSDVVNAFALPGGYVYVTTGLMALANDEAELAGVIGHEIGHVTARHTAERYSQAVIAQLGVGLLGAVTGSQAAGDLAGLGAGAYLSGYSRGQESDADMLGVRYMARAGYDTGAMASFLSSLAGESAVENLILGREGGDQFSLFATHPRTEQRIEDAIQLVAQQAPVGGPPVLGTGVYLDAIDGLYYGGDPENGFIRGRAFVHPALRFRFAVPEGFHIFNSLEMVSAIGPDDSRILFDSAPERVRGPMVAYLTRVWAPNLPLREVESIGVNGMEAGTGTMRANTGNGAFDLRLLAIRFSQERIYRFLFVSRPHATASLRAGFRRTTYSFRAMSAREASQAQPLRVRVHEVRQGETVDDLARRMPFDDYQVQRFLALNGMKPVDRLVPGQRVKIIAN